MTDAADIALIPPPTQINNTHKHFDVAIAVIVMMVVATALTLARLICRWTSRSFGRDDWAMVPALLLYVGHSIMIAYCNLHGGTGKPLWEITLGEYSVWFKGVIATAFIYPTMTAAIRVSILLFYYRIFGRTEDVIRWLIWICIVLTSLYVVTFSIIPGFICTPLSAGWHPLTRKQHCKSDELYYLYNVALYSSSLGLDILLLVMPIWPVMRLQMSLKRRLAGLGMFLLGASACIAVSYKLAIYVMQWRRTGSVDPRWFLTQMSRVIPPQWDKYGYTFWIPTQVEPTVALIGSALPALRAHLLAPFQRLSSALSSLPTSKTRRTSPDTDNNAKTSRSQKEYIKMGGLNDLSQKKTTVVDVDGV